MREDLRHDRCKCGKFIIWDEGDNSVICKYCGTEFKVESDSVLVYWLEENVKTKRGFYTEAR
ncbi:hypothetical protein LCGC14_1035370 [marine sediment metagenome]|uniref:Uncharacterized protein n=1 Tax=marine sediment metagenome TaxID=412755 RepID=A0A0F9MXZ6_9ZZZZ